MSGTKISTCIDMCQPARRQDAIAASASSCNGTGNETASSIARGRGRINWCSSSSRHGNALSSSFCLHCTYLTYLRLPTGQVRLQYRYEGIMIWKEPQHSLRLPSLPRINQKGKGGCVFVCVHCTRIAPAVGPAEDCTSSPSMPC